MPVQRAPNRRKARLSNRYRSDPMSISEIIETVGEGDTATEVCATAETQYDSSAQKLSVALDSFARCVAASGDRAHEVRSWLPPAEHVTEHLSSEEAEAFTKDVFHSWVKRVRATIPHQLTATSNIV